MNVSLPVQLFVKEMVLISNEKRRSPALLMLLFMSVCIISNNCVTAIICL